MNFIYLIYPFIPLLILVVTYWIWIKYGKNNYKENKNVYDFPFEFNSLELAFLYKGYATSIDVVSLVLYLANKGYIKIVDLNRVDKAMFFDKVHSFKIIKMKEYDGTNEYEKQFLEELFKKRKSTTFRAMPITDEELNNENEVTSNELYNYFYDTIRKIIEKINSQKDKIFVNNKFQKILINLLTIFTFLWIALPPILMFSEESFLIYIIVVILFTCRIFPSIVESTMNIIINKKESKKSKIYAIIAEIVGFVVLIGIPWYIFIVPSLIKSNYFLISFILGLVSIIIMIILKNNMLKRTDYGNEMLLKIDNFHNFIEHCTTEELSNTNKKDYNFYYKILPYAYALREMELWTNRFETMSLQKPIWYDNPLISDHIGKDINNTMVSVLDVMTYHLKSYYEDHIYEIYK